MTQLKVQGDAAVPDLWRRILAVDETSHEYFAERSEIPGAVLFTNPGAPRFNLAIVGEAPGGDQGALLDRIVAHFSAVEVLARIRLTPLSQPSGWPELLAARGFCPVTDEDEEFMALQPDQVAGEAPAVLVRRLAADDDPEDLARMLRVQRAAFGESGVDDDRERGMRLARASLTNGRYRFYLATVDGRAAGAATARFAGDTAGIYGVGTLPEARRRGVGTAVIRQIVREARETGCDTIYLSAVPGSYAIRLYERMGFARLFQVRDYLEAAADERA